MQMSPPTLLDLAGATLTPAKFSGSILVIIDAQMEYLSGRLPLANIEAAVTAIRDLIDAARRQGCPIIHVVHHSRAGGGIFEPDSQGAQIIPTLEPADGEAVIVKRLPNAFAGTDLAERIDRIRDNTGRDALIICGFMTHMCVSSTIRAALDLGWPSTVVADATASRDLPHPFGGIVPADQVQTAALAALNDRFAAIVSRAADFGLDASAPLPRTSANDPSHA